MAMVVLHPGSTSRVLRCVLNRLHDVDVAGAAAEISGDRPSDVGLTGRGAFLQQRVAGHQHAGRTESALQSVLLKEAFLDWIELAIFLQSFDSHDLTAVGLNGERRTRLYGLAVEQDGARAARRCFAPDVSACQGEHLAAEMDEPRARLDL